jgi:hypothetical protein
MFHTRMKNPTQRKREALSQVKRAGEKIIDGSQYYSCIALTAAGGRGIKPFYAEWFLEGDPDTTVSLLLQRNGLRPRHSCIAEFPEDRDHRLIMLAMFHVLIQSGDIKP